MRDGYTPFPLWLVIVAALGTTLENLAYPYAPPWITLRLVFLTLNLILGWVILH